MKPLPHWLSKTKLLRGYRCVKSLYLTIHHPDYEAPITPDTEVLFEQGREVGKAAQNYFPQGVLVDSPPWEFQGAITKTQALVSNGVKTLFEAAFQYQGFYARADIIHYLPEVQRWQIIEVKSTTKVKPEHIDDLALQAWIMANSGLPIASIQLMHLNPDCRYPHLEDLFITIDLTEDIRQRYRSIAPKLSEFLATLKQSQIPDVDIGSHCLAPNECGFKAYCWQAKQIPAFSVLNLPGMWDRRWDFYQQGIITLEDKRLTELTPLQERIIYAHQTNQRFVDAASMRSAIADWQFPLFFLDFETINPPIPCYPNCKPYQPVPFQFSVHYWPDPTAEISHQAFLHESSTDPRPSLIPDLLSACEGTGTILAYFSQFEADRIKDLAEAFPHYATSLLALIERLRDPFPIIREHVYDPAFAGSFSLKKVAPALLGESHRYDGLSVANGKEAQRAFNRLINPKTPAAEKAKIREAMLTYCEKDTLVMVFLVKWMLANIN